MAYQVDSGEQSSAHDEPLASKSRKRLRLVRTFSVCVVAILMIAATAEAAPPRVGRILRRVGYAYGHLKNYHVVATRERIFVQSHSRFSRQSEISLDVARQGRVRIKLSGDGLDVLLVSDGKTIWQFAPGKNQYTQRQRLPLAYEPGAQGPAGGREDLFQQSYDLLVGHFVKLPQLEKDATLEGQEEIAFEGRQILCYRIAIRSEGLTDELWISRSSFLVLQEIRTRAPASPGSRTLVDDNVRVSEMAMQARHLPDFFTFTPPANAWRVVALEIPGSGEGVEGLSAGDFTLRNLAGKNASLNDFRGKIVVLSFWATWCAPCKKELPTLQEIFDERKDVAVLTVDDENPATVRNFLNENNFTFPALIDQDRTLFKKFAVHFIPTVLVIDQKGVIVNEIVGWDGPQKLLSALEVAGISQTGPRGSGKSETNLSNKSGDDR